jgi:hypothetical protein
MKKRIKSILWIALIVALSVLAMVMVCPQVAATRYGYFDENNGRSRVDWVSFGRVYRRSIEETDYSRLLKKLGFEEMPPDWKLSSQEEQGLRGLLFRKYVDYYEGNIEADSKTFALTMELQKPDQAKARELVERFRALVREGDRSKIRDFVTTLMKGK